MPSSISVIASKRWVVYLELSTYSKNKHLLIVVKARLNEFLMKNLAYLSKKYNLHFAVTLFLDRRKFMLIVSFKMQIVCTI